MRLHRGAYLDARLWQGLDPTQQYQRRVIAAALASSSHPIVSHASAAVLWGIPLIGAMPKQVHVLATRAAGTRTQAGFRRHASRDLGIDLQEFAGVRVTGFDRTLIEFAAIAPFEAAVAAIDWALLPPAAQRPKPVTTRERLRGMVERLQVVSGRTRLEKAIAFADPLSGSPGESLSRAGMLELGFPVPQLQVAFSDRLGKIGEVDFWWPQFDLIGEFDGRGKYLRDVYTRGMPTAEIVIAEKNRENRLRALGPGMTRWDWPVASEPALLFDHLRAAGLPSRRRGPLLRLRPGREW